VNEQFLKLGSSPLGSINLSKKFIDRITDRVLLKGPISSVLSGLNVIDSLGEFIGIVRDTVESGDFLDSLIVENEEGEMIVVTLEDIGLIDEWVELRISGDELYETQ